jgi:hypothetical protein
VSASIRQIMDEMAATLLAVVGPAVAPEVEVQVTPRRNFNPTPPSIDIYPSDPFRSAPDNASLAELQGDLVFLVRARVSTVDNIAGQDLLLRLMDELDPIGVAGALMDDQSLNGLASSVDAESNSGYRLYIEPGDEPRPLLGCEWTVRIFRVIT